MDVQIYREVNVNSDHNSVIAEMNVGRFKRKQEGYIHDGNIGDWRQTKKRMEYIKEMRKILIEEIKPEWNYIKDSFTAVMRKVLGVKRKE